MARAPVARVRMAVWVGGGGIVGVVVGSGIVGSLVGSMGWGDLGRRVGGVVVVGGIEVGIGLMRAGWIECGRGRCWSWAGEDDSFFLLFQGYAL